MQFILVHYYRVAIYVVLMWSNCKKTWSWSTHQIMFRSKRNINKRNTHRRRYRDWFFIVVILVVAMTDWLLSFLSFLFNLLRNKSFKFLRLPTYLDWEVKTVQKVLKEMVGSDELSFGNWNVNPVFRVLWWKIKRQLLWKMHLNVRITWNPTHFDLKRDAIM